MQVPWERLQAMGQWFKTCRWLNSNSHKNDSLLYDWFSDWPIWYLADTATESTCLCDTEPGMIFYFYFKYFVLSSSSYVKLMQFRLLHPRTVRADDTDLGIAQRFSPSQLKLNYHTKHSTLRKKARQSKDVVDSVSYASPSGTLHALESGNLSRRVEASATHVSVLDWLTQHAQLKHSYSAGPATVRSRLTGMEVRLPCVSDNTAVLHS